MKAVDGGGYPGGLVAYLKNARALLKASATGENPFEGMKPEVRFLTVAVLFIFRFTLSNGLGVEGFDLRSVKLTGGKAVSALR